MTEMQQGIKSNFNDSSLSESSGKHARAQTLNPQTAISMAYFTDLASAYTKCKMTTVPH